MTLQKQHTLSESNKCPLFSASVGQQSKVTLTTSHTKRLGILLRVRLAWHGILLSRKQLFSLHSQTWHARKSMHCPHKSPHFLSIQETVSHSLAPDILQVSGSVCEIVLPIKTCLSMKTSARMRPYRYVICCGGAGERAGERARLSSTHVV